MGCRKYSLKLLMKKLKCNVESMLGEIKCICLFESGHSQGGPAGLKEISSRRQN